MEYIAHRGASFAAPENSIASLKEAIVQGAHRIEFDLQITKDHIPVIMHDSTTTRTTNKALEVASTMFAKLREAHLSNGELIPTLEEYCCVAAGKIALNVELKSTTDAVAKKVLETLQTHKLLSTTLLSSFDSRVLLHFRKLGYQGRTGLIVGSSSKNISQRFYEMWPISVLKKVKATDLVLHHRLAHVMLRKAVKRENFGLLYWTSIADEQKEKIYRDVLYRKMARTRPDGIILGRVAEAKNTIGYIPPT